MNKQYSITTQSSSKANSQYSITSQFSSTANSQYSISSQSSTANSTTMASTSANNVATPPSPSLQGQKPHPSTQTGMVAGCVIVGIVVVFMVLGIVFVYYRRRKNNAEDRVLSRSIGSDATFTYDEVILATDGFSEANLLGQGNFGYVHKGVLPGGKEVAVKQLKTGSRQVEEEFQAKIDFISRVRHEHLVSLVGYCIKGAEGLLVYDFVPNNTLEFHLHGLGQAVLEWEVRLKIATGSAKGLAYLHEDCNPKIIHNDIKASNILVDHKFEAKVSDFGLAKSFSDTNTHITPLSTRVRTFGYLAPEYVSSGKFTEKSDVYSYGVVLLELITGHSSRNEGFVQWARPLLTQALEDGDFALVDPRLETNYNENEMARMVACAAACVRHSAWLRPRMSQIVHALEGVASLMDLRQGITPGNSAVYDMSSYYNSPAKPM